MDIKRYRKSKNLTQEALAQMVGVTQSNICRIESGETQPSLKVAQALAKALDCNLDELLQEPEEAEPVL